MEYELVITATFPSTPREYREVVVWSKAYRD
jgi:hypothetical protein